MISNTRYRLFNRTESPLAITFPLEDFIASLRHALDGAPNLDFWCYVVIKASKGRANLTPDQRSHLKSYIQENKFHITQGFSKREIISLNRHLESL